MNEGERSATDCIRHGEVMERYMQESLNEAD